VLTIVDLGPAAQRLAALVAAVPEEQLGAPTPCPDYALGDLLDHVSGLALAFRAAATRRPMEAAAGPSGDAARLGDDWRARIPLALDLLAEAWADPAAWTGTTEAGGVEMSGPVAGLVALDELVVHGWDVARACGRPYDVDDASLEAVHAFVASFAEPGQESSSEDLFGPAVPVPADAPLLHRVLGLTGRDPGWRPPS
jgi:uncharacterized protein (TIGR03086 family)